MNCDMASNIFLTRGMEMENSLPARVELLGLHFIPNRLPKPRPCVADKHDITIQLH